MTVDWERLSGRAVFITGADKNAGKTTLLNYILDGLRARGAVPAFLSAGYDGEEADHLSGRPKPRVRAREGELVATAEAALETADAGLEVLEVFPGEAVLGRAVVTRVRRPGLVELIGPPGNRALAVVLDCLREKYRPEHLLVDGAVDRITQVGADRAAAAHAAAYAMVLRAEPSTLTRAAGIVRLHRLLSALPSPAEAALAQEMVEVPGALTEAKLAELPADDRPLLVEDFTRVFVDAARMEDVCSRRAIFLRRTFDLLFFSVNLFDVEQEKFLAAVGSGDDILFNPYREEAPVRVEQLAAALRAEPAAERGRLSAAVSAVPLPPEAGSGALLPADLLLFKRSLSGCRELAGLLPPAVLDTLGGDFAPGDLEDSLGLPPGDGVYFEDAASQELAATRARIHDLDARTADIERRAREKLSEIHGLDFGWREFVVVGEQRARRLDRSEVTVAPCDSHNAVVRPALGEEGDRLADGRASAVAEEKQLESGLLEELRVRLDARRYETEACAAALCDLRAALASLATAESGDE